MRRCLFIILGLQLLISFSLAQTENVPMLTGSKANLEMDQVIESLSGLKNPFQPSVPEKRQVIIKPEPVKKPKPEPKPTPQLEPKQDPIPPSLTLNGMVWGNIEPQAIINEKVVSVGEDVLGAKVLSITRNGVEMDYQGVKVNLAVDSNLDKK